MVVPAPSAESDSRTENSLLADHRGTDIDADALRTALEVAEREGIRFDCKRLVETTDEAKLEWALDVTSFANTAGGVLLLGADETDGRLSDFVGITGDVDSELQRLESLLRDRVDPSIPGLSLNAVDVDGTTVIVVHIPHSWRAPHLVRRGSRWQLTKRTSSGKYVLNDAGEVRAAFAETYDATTRAHRWHDDILSAAIAGDLPVPRSRDAFAVITVRPLAAGAPGALPVLDVNAALSSGQAHSKLRPLYMGGGHGPRPSVDGIMATSVSQGSSGLVIMYRDSSIAYYDDEMFHRSKDLPGTVLVTAIVDAVERSADAVEWAGGTLPAVFEMSMHGVDGWQLHTKASRNSFEDLVFDRDLLRLPAVLLDRQPTDRSDAATIARPLLDALWQAAGQRACEHFDADGRWVEPR